MSPAPTPEPTETTSASVTPLAAPQACSPTAAAERSFATRTGWPSAPASRPPRETFRQPRFGALTTMPVAPRHCPATPTPTVPREAGSTPASAAAPRASAATTRTTASGPRSTSSSLRTATIAPAATSTTAARALVPPTSTPSARRATGLRPQLALQLVHLGADELLDLDEPRLRLGLEAEHQDGLRVGGAHEPPPVGEDHADAVHRHRLVALREELLGAPDQLELLVLGAVDAQLGRAEGLRHVREQGRHPRVGPRQQLQQAPRRVDAVVEAEPAVAEEDVTAHLAGQQRLLLLHLRLDEAVPRLPHDPAAALRRDVVVEGEGALHLADDRGPRHLGQQGPREQDHDLVAPEHGPLLVHRAHAVRVAVVRDTDVGLHLAHLRLQVLEVLLDRRIGVVVREPAVHLDEERDDVDPERLEEGDGDDAARPVAGVDHHLEPPLPELEAPLHLGAVRRDDVVAPDAPRAGSELALLDDPAQLLDLLAVEGALPEAELEAVVLRRVVRPGDLTGAVDPRERVRREVDERRRHHAEVDDVAAGGAERGDELAVEAIARLATVTPHDDGLPAGGAHLRPERLPDERDRLLRQVLVHEPADVVLAE